jgi:hypothetical protein
MEYWSVGVLRQGLIAPGGGRFLTLYPGLEPISANIRRSRGARLACEAVASRAEDAGRNIVWLRSWV